MRIFQRKKKIGKLEIVRLKSMSLRNSFQIFIQTRQAKFLVEEKTMRKRTREPMVICNNITLRILYVKNFYYAHFRKLF